MKHARIETAAKRAVPLAILMIASLLLTVFVCTLLSPAVSLLDAQLTDALFRFRYLVKGKEKPSSYLVHVLIDDESLQAGNGFFSDRETVASLIGILHEQGTAKIALDILYGEARPSDQDRNMIESVRNAGSVFMPLILLDGKPGGVGKKSVVLDRTRIHAGTADDPRTKSIVAPFSAIADEAAGFGYVNLDPDKDGKNRSFSLVRSSGEYLIPSLPFAAICAFLDVKEGDILVRAGESVLLRNATFPGNRHRNIAIPIDEKGNVRLNHVGPWLDSFTAISATELISAQGVDILRSQVHDIVNGALVLISDVSVRDNDRGNGVFDAVIPNAEIFMTVMNMILEGRFITYPDPFVLALVFFALSALLVLAVSSLRSVLPVFFACAGGIVVYGALWITLFLANGITIPLVFPVVVILVYGSLSGIFQFYLQKRAVSEYGSLFLEERKERERLGREIESGRGDRAIGLVFERIMHDLRNLLQSIPTIAGRTGKSHGPKNPVREDTAAATVRKITEIAEDVLYHLQMEEGRLRAIVRENDAGNIAAECYTALTAEAARKKIDYQFSPPRSPIILYCDGPKVSRILLNLIQNAIKFTPPSGRVKVSVAEPLQYDETLYHWKRERPKPRLVASIRVEDSGCGIPAKDKESVFMKYSKLQPSGAGAREGFGLGLAIARDFAELHYGHISIQSEEGAGSVFTLFLPMGREHFSAEEISPDDRIIARGEMPVRAELPQIEPCEATRETVTAVYGREEPCSARVRMFGFDDPGCKPSPPVIVVDDDISILERFHGFLSESGYSTHALVRGGFGIIDLLGDLGSSVLIVFLDLGMEEPTGEILFTEIRRLFPDQKVVIVTETNDAEIAVSYMKRGAYDYVTKPFEEPRIRAILSHAKKEQVENRRLFNFSYGHNKEILEHPDNFREIITNNRKMIDRLSVIEKNAGKPITFLVLGESGTGKELIARAIHAASGRKGQFVPVNIAGIGKELLNSTLFGYRKGAFTGAECDMDGLIKAADSGTLFLDEIGEMHVDTQVHLLRLLQEREYYKVGSTTPEKADIGIVAATNSVIREKIGSGSFREDLYYRLAECELVIPPLRERKEDIPLLALHFHRKHNGNVEPEEYRGDILRLLQSYDFPGNVRELESIIKRALDDKDPAKLLEGVVRESLRGKREPGLSVLHDGTGAQPVVTYSGQFPTMEALRDGFYAEALKQSNDDVQAASDLIGVNKTTFYRWLKDKKKNRMRS